MHNIQERDVHVGVEMAWHRLTKVVDAITPETCEFNYGMEMRPNFIVDDEGELVKNGYYSVVSKDDNRPIGQPVTKRYKVFSNSEIFDSVRRSLGGTDHQIVSCGTVSDRALGFISVKVDENFHAAGREHEPTLNVMWGHGGNMNVVAQTGVTCIVCENTFNAAKMEKGMFGFKVRHTTNAELEEMEKAIESHLGVVAEFRDALNTVGSYECSVKDAYKTYVGYLYKDRVATDFSLTSRMHNQANAMLELYATGKGNRGETYADVFNGLTEYYTHNSIQTGDRGKQYYSSEFGGGASRKSSFLPAIDRHDKRQGLLDVARTVEVQSDKDGAWFPSDAWFDEKERFLEAVTSN
jgi:hypothetical protein